MSFPDLNALIYAAKVHKFRELNTDETEDEYRVALADHVQPIDLLESMEIRTGKGWDEFTDLENIEVLLRGGL